MQRLLIIGCGDVALRAATGLSSRYRLFALSHSPERFALLRASGISPIPGDLDDTASLSRLPGLAHVVLHFAPPKKEGDIDSRTRNLLSVLSKSEILPHRLVYISTSGVYGNCGGQIVHETRPPHPVDAAAKRRLDAECRIRDWGLRNRVSVSILRVPGIYAPDRFEGMEKRMAMANPAGYANLIHADDLACIAVKAASLGKPQRIYHAVDDSNMKMADYLDMVADRLGLPRPMRAPENGADSSRRLDNSRMKRELHIALRYPTVKEGLRKINFRDGKTE